jgi:CBS domain-containing protein
VQELWVALAGPAVNVVIALLLTAWLTLQNAWEPLSTLGIADGSLVERLLAVNMGLVIFNMLPAFPMDGGRVLRAVLAMRMDQARATNIAATVGKTMAVLFAIYGLFANPMLILIAYFVWSGASQEASVAQVKAVISGACVRDAMVTQFHTVTVHTTLREMIVLMLSGAQRDFPVVKRESVIGMLAHTDILAAIQGSELETPVAAIMRTDIPTLNESELLDAVLLREREDENMSLPVLNNGVLVGMLTAENIHEYFIIRDAHRGLNVPWSRGSRMIRKQPFNH